MAAELRTLEHLYRIYPTLLKNELGMEVENPLGTTKESYNFNTVSLTDLYTPQP